MAFQCKRDHFVELAKLLVIPCLNRQYVMMIELPQTNQQRGPFGIGRLHFLKLFNRLISQKDNLKAITYTIPLLGSTKLTGVKYFLFWKCLLAVLQAKNKVVYRLSNHTDFKF